MSTLYIFCKAIHTKKKKEQRGNSKLYGLLLDRGVVLRGEHKKGQGVKYLGVLICFGLPRAIKFDKLMTTLKSKMITWSTCK
jgi:hypothetical protein